MRTPSCRTTTAPWLQQVPKHLLCNVHDHRFLQAKDSLLHCAQSCKRCAGQAEAWEQAMLADGAFHCHLCAGVKPLRQLAAMECQCMICEACMSQHVTRFLQKLTDVVSSQVDGSSKRSTGKAAGGLKGQTSNAVERWWGLLVSPRVQAWAESAYASCIPHCNRDAGWAAPAS